MLPAPVWSISKRLQVGDWLEGICNHQDRDWSSQWGEWEGWTGEIFWRWNRWNLVMTQMGTEGERGVQDDLTLLTLVTVDGGALP